MKHSTKKIAKSGMAMMLTGTFLFSTPAVLAEETDSQPIDLQVVMEENEDNVPSEEVDTTEPVVNSKDEQENTTGQIPSLVPGDFFYFLKIVLEKIQLALTFDDTEEAKLLAEFASERLAEAEALFAQGDEDKAIETIEKALENIQSTEKMIEEAPEEDATKEEIEKQTEAEDAEAVVDDENSADKTSEPDETIIETENLMAQNIVALTAAMGKVKNPIAKASLQKNIDKSYAKLAKKLEKMEEKKNKKKKAGESNVTLDEETVFVDEEMTVEHNQTAGTLTPTEMRKELETVAPVVEENITGTVEAPINTAELKQTASTPVPAPQPPSQPAAEVKVEVKEQRKAEKVELKQEKQEAKAEAKAEKQAVKEEKKAAKENGKGNGQKDANQQ
ncbi:DUF5667 domain-containing protein [Niallia endozanthoxylica]|uniref:DUF5667 domain-containing protein n=1 Tax=Niallia endozanthoxylica TaxID=2036016 RepID=A0A5J5HZU5_9BACI|nr:DUF5667 domain-containing protein [Niallia endozanthoxylica]KAA9027605.1 hypothetical protein F4V44_06295 [Niallia endozanthoxylica]